MGSQRKGGEVMLHGCPQKGGDSGKVKRILLTGAAGIVGTALRPLLAQRHDHVLMTDIAAIDDPAVKRVV